MIDGFLKRKEKILITVVQILDEKGIKGLTTREIARRQGITEPVIYKHFKNKKDILSTIITEFSSFDESIINTIRENNMNFRDAVMYYAQSYSTYYENYPEMITLMYSFDIFRYDEDLNKKMVGIIGRRYDFIVSLVKEGFEKKETETSLNPNDFAGIISNIIWMTIYNWKLEEREWNLSVHITKKLEFILNSKRSKK
jgi:AcrR family transcriptional regulator